MNPQTARLLAAVLVTTSAGCADPAPTGGVASPSTGPETTAPTYAETATCRQSMRPVLDAMTANGSAGLDFATFEKRRRALNRSLDQALLGCSAKVSRPVRLAMYHYAVAGAMWSACDRRACTGPVLRHLASAQLLARRAGRAADR